MTNDSLTGTNGTPVACVVQFFLVDDLFEEGQYAERSNQAHGILGAFILSIVMVWAVVITSLVRGCTLRRGFLGASCLQTAMGAYLLLWVFWLMAPDHVSDGKLFDYVTRDLLQIQHIAIAFLLISAGIIEFLWVKSYLSASTWHMLWYFNSSLVGVLFLVHPQHNYSGTALHTLLGVAITFASMLYALGKFIHHCELDSATVISWYTVASGVFYGIASALLMLFRESTDKHRGIDWSCHGSWPVTVLALLVAPAVLGAAIGVVLYDKCRLCTSMGGGRAQQFRPISQIELA